MLLEANVSNWFARTNSPGPNGTMLPWCVPSYSAGRSTHHRSCNHPLLELRGHFPLGRGGGWVFGCYFGAGEPLELYFLVSSSRCLAVYHLHSINTMLTNWLFWCTTFNIDSNGEAYKATYALLMDTMELPRIDCFFAWNIVPLLINDSHSTHRNIPVQAIQSEK